jgi:hypothetical protein
MAQFKSKHAIINITFSHLCNAMQCNAMQYNAILSAVQCNAMQYNAMQCNAMQCSIIRNPSVRTEWSQSVIFFYFFIFFSQYVRKSRVCTEHECHGWTDKFQFFFLSSGECHGWTDKFQLFQRFSSVAYSQVSLSVRTEVPTKKKKKKNMLNKHRNTDPIGGNTFNGKILLLNLLLLIY